MLSPHAALCRDDQLQEDFKKSEERLRKSSRRDGGVGGTVYGGWKLLSSNRSPESSGFSLNICSTRAWVGNLNINVVHQHLLNPCLKAPRARPACAPSPARSQPSLLRAVVSGHSQGEGEAHLENCCIFIKRPSITPAQGGIENIWCPGSGCFFF